MRFKHIKENIAYKIMFYAIRYWADHYLDQWDKIKFDTEYGMVYVAIERHDLYPNSFFEVDRNGNPKK